MTDLKLEAIEQFQEMIDLDRKVASVISKVMARSPHAILIAWEDSDGVKATSIPFSACLVKGMIDTLFDMIFDSPDSDEDDSAD